MTSGRWARTLPSPEDHTRSPSPPILRDRNSKVIGFACSRARAASGRGWHRASLAAAARRPPWRPEPRRRNPQREQARRRQRERLQNREVRNPCRVTVDDIILTAEESARTEQMLEFEDAWKKGKPL